MITQIVRFIFPVSLWHNRKPMPPGYLTVKEAAEKLALSEARVKALCKSGRLVAEKFGWAWSIKESDLKEFEATRNRRAGRPPKK